MVHGACCRRNRADRRRRQAIPQRQVSRSSLAQGAGLGGPGPSADNGNRQELNATGPPNRLPQGLARVAALALTLAGAELRRCGSSPTLRRPTLTTRNRAPSLPAASALTAPRLPRDSHRQRLARLRVHGMGLPASDIDRLVDIGRRHLRRLAEATSTKATVTATDFAIIPSIHATGCRSPNQ
jgi:hypothetical protein